METVRGAAISGQYLMWIDNNKIGYDYAGLDEVLSYRHETINNLRYELFELLWRGEYLGRLLGGCSRRIQHGNYQCSTCTLEF